MIKTIARNIFIYSFFYLFFIENLSASLEEDLSKKYLGTELEKIFPNVSIQLTVQNQQVIVYQFPDDFTICENIRLHLERLTGSSNIIFDRSYLLHQSSYTLPLSNSQNFNLETATTPDIEEGEWLPELNPFFPTLLAQPHIVGYSAGYRTYDKVFKIDCLPVSIGDQFSLYQFKNALPGQLFFGIEACVWAIFEAKSNSLALINADYYVALPFTYIHDKFAARLRIFHESSHLGDEILIEKEYIKRLNPSMEVIDLFLSYDLTNSFTLFGGASRVLRSDKSYKIKPKGFYYGFNFYLDRFKLHLCNLEARPYIATYFNHAQENKWKPDSSIALGYQWDKLYGHKLRLFLEGHEGYSQEGQFSKQKTRYLAVRLLYGY